MSAVTNAPAAGSATAAAATSSYNLKNVQDNLLGGAVKSVAKDILLFLIASMQESTKQGFKPLAEKRAVVFDKEVSQQDEKIKMVYHLLFHASAEHCLNDKFASKALLMVKSQSPKELYCKFLPSFVLPQTRILVEKLQKEEPKSLDDANLWKVKPETVDKYKDYNYQ